MDQATIDKCSSCYVYTFRDPDTKIVRYVGKGSGGRAWVTTRYGQPKVTTQLGAWINEGFIPSDWVVIEARGLDSKSALKIERELITLYSPDLNNSDWSYCAVLSKEQISSARRLRKQGLSYDRVAKSIGTSTMTVYRLLNNITKEYKKDGLILTSDCKKSVRPLAPRAEPSRALGRNC